MNAHTQTSREAEYERVTFEVRGTKHVMTYKGHEMSYLSQTRRAVPLVSLEDALLHRGCAIPKGARVVPNDDLSCRTLAALAQDKRGLSIEGRLYTLDC